MSDEKARQPTPLTTESCAPVADNQHSQTAGPGGQVLLQDQHLLEKLARFLGSESVTPSLLEHVDFAPPEAPGA